MEVPVPPPARRRHGLAHLSHPGFHSGSTRSVQPAVAPFDGQKEGGVLGVEGLDGGGRRVEDCGVVGGLGVEEGGGEDGVVSGRRIAAIVVDNCGAVTAALREIVVPDLPRSGGGHVPLRPNESGEKKAGGTGRGGKEEEKKLPAGSALD